MCYYYIIDLLTMEFNMFYTMSTYEVKNNGHIKSFTMVAEDGTTVVLTPADDRFSIVRDALDVNRDLAKSQGRATNDALCDLFRMFGDEVEL